MGPNGMVINGGSGDCGGCCAPSAGECSGACGGAETACCEAAGAVTNTSWQYVGQGGSYNPVTSFNYVGEGAGSYEKEVVTTFYGWKFRKCCMILVPLLLIPALIYLLMNMNKPDIQPAPAEDPAQIIIPDPTPPPAPMPVLPPLPPAPLPTPAPTPAPMPAPTPAPAPAPVPQGPLKTCMVFGDPHVLTFDGKRSDYYTPGEYWIVKSGTVKIQGKYAPTRMTNGLSVTKEIGISGSFINNGKLIISVESVTWNGAAVGNFGFANLGSTWNNANPPIKVVYNAQGTVMQNSRVGKALHVVHVMLPLGVTLEINRWNEPQEGQYMNTRISMGAQPGQDGHCGNFNGNPGDDSRTAVRSRVGTTGVPQGELIFPGAKTPVSPGARPDLNNCPEGELNAAMAKCKAAEHTTFPSHACLIDTCLGHMSPKPA